MLEHFFLIDETVAYIDMSKVCSFQEIYNPKLGYRSVHVNVCGVVYATKVGTATFIALYNKYNKSNT